LRTKERRNAVTRDVTREMALIISRPDLDFPVEAGESRSSLLQRIPGSRESDINSGMRASRPVVSTLLRPGRRVVVKI